MRPNADSGFWCCFLLPCAFLSISYHDGFQGAYSFVFGLCLATSILLLYEEFMVETAQSFLSRGLVFLLLAIVFIIQYGVNYYAYVCFASIILFHKTYKALLSQCPDSFTIGEAAIVAQLITVISATFGISVIDEIYEPTAHVTDDISAYYKSFQVILQTCIVAVATLHMCPLFRTNPAFYIMCLGIGLVALLFWTWYLKANALLWMIGVPFLHQKRICLLIVWILLTCASALFVTYEQTKSTKDISTITRKWFHLIIAAVYLPGVVFDTEFLFLASSVAVFIFVFLEAVRVLDIWPFGETINDAFQIFLDEKDSGFLILTHIYLLVGCSCPLWIHPPSAKGFHISHMSGLISVAFGDTAASAVGSTFGRHKWKGSKKTVEGTLAAIVVQLIPLLAILMYGNMLTQKNIFLVILSSVCTSILEAKTTQVDNIVLPIFMFIFLAMIH